MRPSLGATDLSKEYCRPGDLRELALAFLDLADAVLQRGDDVLAGELEGRQRVLERQHGQHFAHGDDALVDRGAQAAAVLEDDLDALVLDAVEDRVGDQIAHLAFAGAAVLAAAVDRLSVVSETSLFFSSSIGAPSSLMRASTAASGVIDLSRRSGRRSASLTTPLSSKTTLNSPRYFE